MTAHTKGKHGTGPQDRDRRSRGNKLDREQRNTDARAVADADLRGKGREAVAQQRRARKQLSGAPRRKTRAGGESVDH